jgi:hypothetical protein
MEHHERIFNYILSRARRIVENAFGILAHKFRVLLRTMHQRPETCRKIITTCVIPHNLIRLRYPATHNNLMDLEDQNQNVIPGAWGNDNQNFNNKLYYIPYTFCFTEPAFEVKLWPRYLLICLPSSVPVFHALSW